MLCNNVYNLLSSYGARAILSINKAADAFQLKTSLCKTSSAPSYIHRHGIRLQYSSLRFLNTEYFVSFDSNKYSQLGQCQLIANIVILIGQLSIRNSIAISCIGAAVEWETSRKSSSMQSPYGNQVYACDHKCQFAGIVHEALEINRSLC